jgi:uncharacterized protein
MITRESAKKRLLFVVAVCAASSLAVAQEIQVNRQNKTIAVTADDFVNADAEVATLEIGFHNFGPTQDATYSENVRASEQITRALLNARIPKENIQTERLQLSRTEIDEKWTPEMKKERQFTAQQSWHVSVSAVDAQSVIDLAAKSGANEVNDVDWNVKDPIALQARAGAAALAKARSIAEQMATGLGTKLGELVYASNRAPTLRRWFGDLTVNADVATVGRALDKQPKLILFPKKVRSDATVYAVFSIE